MITIEKTAELKAIINKAKEENKTVGFVPTMGALHQGHISLVKQCRAVNDICVVSIFVNPTQFNNATDLEHYPRTMEADCNMLDKANVDYIFAPTVEEVYPEVDNREFDFQQLDKVMEGEHRPGHFNGVAQVVSRLFDMVQPDNAYFGEKDFQQLAIIKAMVKQLDIVINIVPCAIVREDDGLAMSSRNTRLTSKHREVAPLIFQTLKASKALAKDNAIADVKQYVIDTINANALFEVEYFEIADTLSLQTSGSWTEEGDKVGCIAVFAGDIRLIDNIVY